MKNSQIFDLIFCIVTSLIIFRILEITVNTLTKIKWSWPIGFSKEEQYYWYYPKKSPPGVEMYSTNYNSGKPYVEYTGKYIWGFWYKRYNKKACWVKYFTPLFEKLRLPDKYES